MRYLGAVLDADQNASAVVFDGATRQPVWSSNLWKRPGNPTKATVLVLSSTAKDQLTSDLDSNPCIIILRGLPAPRKVDVAAHRLAPLEMLPRGRSLLAMPRRRDVQSEMLGNSLASCSQAMLVLPDSNSADRTASPCPIGSLTVKTNHTPRPSLFVPPRGYIPPAGFYKRGQLPRCLFLTPDPAVYDRDTRQAARQDVKKSL